MKNSLTIPFILLMACIMAGTALNGQETDHVYLKNGSVIRGNIQEVDPSDHVKIQDLCGNIWYYNISDVEKITEEPYQAELAGGGAPLDFKPGFVNITSIGFLAGSANNAQRAPLSLQMVNGWRNALGLFTGAGIGVEFLSTNYMPLFADVRYDFFGNDVVPYIMAKGGYALPLSSDHTEYNTDYTYSGGPLAAIGVGLKIRSRAHFAWDISMLYRYQQTSYTEKYEWNNQEYTYTDVYNRLEIRLGFYID